MTSLVALSIILSISLASVVGIYLAGGTLGGMRRAFGARRIKLAAASLAAALIVASALAGWYFIASAQRAAALTGEGAKPGPASPGSVTSPANGGDLNVLVTKLEDRLRREPGDAQGLALYARTLMELRRFSDAAAAYARAVEAIPDDAALHFERADAAYMASGEKWTPVARDALARGLTLSPAHPEGLWLAGRERFENKDYPAAVRHWEALARVAPPGSDYEKEMKTALVEARALRDGRDPAAELAKAGASGPQVDTAGGPATAPKPAGLAAELRSTLAAMDARTATGPGTAEPASVRGTVSLDPALRSLTRPEDIVFVFARHADPALGSMPLAMLRKRVADLPLQFELSDNNAMSSEQKLSKARLVIITARVSKSGDAGYRPGDLEGVSAAVSPRTGGLHLNISGTR